MNGVVVVMSIGDYSFVIYIILSVFGAVIIAYLVALLIWQRHTRNRPAVKNEQAALKDKLTRMQSFASRQYPQTGRKDKGAYRLYRTSYEAALAMGLR